MRAEVKVDLLSALRSGEYPQAQGNLVMWTGTPGHEVERFCALGVLCQLAVNAEVPGIRRWRGGFEVRMDEGEGDEWHDALGDEVPPPVAAWAEVDYDWEVGDGSVRDFIGGVNDAGFSFVDIAEMIDAEY